MGAAVHTFLEIHNIAHPGRLEYNAVGSEGEKIVLLGLGFRRA